MAFITLRYYSEVLGMQRELYAIVPQRSRQGEIGTQRGKALEGKCLYLLHGLSDDHTIESVEVIGGCNGNLKGISRLLKGMKAEDAIARMEGTTCGPRPTSCPDQIAKNLKKALEEMN